MAVIGTPISRTKSNAQIEQQLLEEIALKWAQTDVLCNETLSLWNG